MRTPASSISREHADERPLEALVEVGELARLERLGERVAEPQHGGGAPTGLVDLDRRRRGRACPASASGERTSSDR